MDQQSKVESYILKYRNSSDQEKTVPGLPRHKVLWGGQRKVWGNRFRPEQMRDKSKCLRAAKVWWSWCFRLLIRKQGSYKNYSLIYKDEALTFLLNLFFFVIGLSHPFSFFTHELFPDWMLAVFWGQRLSPLSLSPAVSCGSWSISEICRCHHHLSINCKRSG